LCDKPVLLVIIFIFQAILLLNTSCSGTAGLVGDLGLGNTRVSA
jgi:hypothetical protein